MLIFYVLFLSNFFSCLYRDRPFFCAVCKFVCVCVCVLYFHLFLFGLVCNKRREGYDVILLLFC